MLRTLAISCVVLSLLVIAGCGDNSTSVASSGGSSSASSGGPPAPPAASHSSSGGESQGYGTAGSDGGDSSSYAAPPGAPGAAGAQGGGQSQARGNAPAHSSAAGGGEQGYGGGPPAGYGGGPPAGYGGGPPAGYGGSQAHGSAPAHSSASGGGQGGYGEPAGGGGSQAHGSAPGHSSAAGSGYGEGEADYEGEEDYDDSGYSDDEGEADYMDGEEQSGEDYPSGSGAGYAGGGYGAAPGGYGDARGAAPPAPPLESLPLQERAEYAIRADKQGDAFDYLYASILVDQTSKTLAQYQWAPALKRPLFAVRWGLGVDVSVVPRGYEGDLYPLGSTQNIPDRASRRDRRRGSYGSGRSRGYGGGEGDSEYEGPGAGYGNSERGYGASGQSGDQPGMAELNEVAGELSDQFVARLKEGIEDGKFGKVLVQLAEAKRRPATPAQGTRGYAGQGRGYGGQRQPGAGYGPGYPGQGYPNGQPGASNAGGRPGQRYPGQGYPNGQPGASSGGAPAGPGYPGQGYPNGQPGASSGGAPAGPGYPGQGYPSSSSGSRPLPGGPPSGTGASNGSSGSRPLPGGPPSGTGASNGSSGSRPLPGGPPSGTGASNGGGGAAAGKKTPAGSPGGTGGSGGGGSSGQVSPPSLPGGADIDLRRQLLGDDQSVWALQGGAGAAPPTAPGSSRRSSGSGRGYSSSQGEYGEGEGDGEGEYGYGRSNSGQRGAVSSSTVPGIVVLGRGDSRDLLDKAGEQGLDVLVMFESKVVQNVRTGFVRNDTHIVVWDVRRREQILRTRALNNIDVQNLRAEDDEEDPVEESLDRLFEDLEEDAEKSVKLIPFPEIIKSEHVKTRIADLINDSDLGELPKLAEIKYYHSKGLIDDATLTKSFQAVLGEMAGAKLAEGKDDERMEAIEGLLPTGV